MLSRVAESIYWMNRYIERAENMSRFVEVSTRLALDLPSDQPEPWPALIQATGDDETFRATYGDQANQANVVEFLTFDRAYSGSLYSSLRMARDNARAVRGVLSTECWEQVNKAFLLVADPSGRELALSEPHAFYGAIKQASQLFVAVSYLTMTHDEGWHFGRLARLVERADKTSRILDVKYFILSLAEAANRESRTSLETSTYDDIQWGALLRCASGLQTYRKRHGLIEPEKVLDFLLFERKFPRSVRYCLTKGERSLHAITGSPMDAGTTAAETTLADLRGRFGQQTKDTVLAGAGLHAFVDAFQRDLNTVGAAIHETFFTLVPDCDARAEDAISILPSAPRMTQTQSQ